MIEGRRWALFGTVLLTSTFANANVVINSQADGSVTFSQNASNDGTCHEVPIGMGEGCIIDVGLPGGGVQGTPMTRQPGAPGNTLKYAMDLTRWSRLETTFVGYYTGRWWSATGKTETICYRRFIGTGNQTQVLGPCVQVGPPLVVCSISGNKDITIPLGSVDRTDFAGVGSRGGPLVSRNIVINCPQTTTVRLTIDGNPGEPGYNGTVLQVNQAAGVATGVGVQLSSKGVPIKLRTALNAGTLPTGISNIPITANFVQTKPTITAGVATTSATYTLTYQ